MLKVLPLEVDVQLSEDDVLLAHFMNSARLCILFAILLSIYILTITFHLFQVLKILSHVNQRYKAEPNWKLPVEALLKLLQGLPSSSALCCNFAVGYVLAALGRETLEVRKLSLLRLMDLFKNFNEPCQIHVLSALVSNVSAIRTKGSTEFRKDLFKFLQNDDIKRSLMAYVIDFLLHIQMRGALSPGHSLESEKPIKSTALAGIQAQLPDSTIIPQISTYSLNQLSEKKVALLSFLGENLDLFQDSDLYVAAVIASTDPINEVQNNGENLFKRLSKEPLSDKNVLQKLFLLFLGQVNDPSSQSQQPQQPQQPQLFNAGLANSLPDAAFDTKRSPASLATRTLILELLPRSKAASVLGSPCIQLFFSAIFAPANIQFPKIHLSALGFVQTMIREFSDAQHKIFAPILLSGLSKYMAWLKEIEYMGPNATTAPTLYKQSEQLKIATLHAFSALGRRSPHLFSGNITLIEELMEDLRANKSVVMSSAIQETLISLCPSSSSISNEVQDRLKRLMASNFVNKEVEEATMDVDPSPNAEKTPAKPTISSKYVSQYYANRCFPFSDEVCRYLNLLGVNDANTQVVQEAKRGLTPYKVVEGDVIALIPKPADSNDESADLHPELSITWPSFTAMVDLVIQSRNPSRTPHTLSYPAPTFQSLITFLHKLLKFHRQFFANAQQDPNGRVSHGSLSGYFTFLQEAIVASGANQISHIAAEHYLEAIQFVPLQVDGSTGDVQMARASPIASINVTASISELQTILLSGSLKPDTMKLVARIIGVLVLNDEPARLSVLEKTSQSLFEHNKSSMTRDVLIGAIHGVSSVIASSFRTGLSIPQHELLTQVCSAIQNVIETVAAEKFVAVGLQNSVLLASCDAIGAIAKWCPDVSEMKSPQIERNLLSTILSLLKSNDVSVVIAASYCIAHICLGNRSLVSSKEVLEGLLATFVVKSEESHFSIGEALSMVTYGWKSLVAPDTLVVSTLQEDQAKMAQTKGDYNAEREEKCMEEVLGKVLQEYFLSARPDTRMASAIWLLTILKNCGAHPEILKQLRAIQIGFQQLLSDPNEILQEVAGKGLSQVYELGDEETRKELVNALVIALQKGAASFKVTADSEIFSAGAVGTTPSGDKLTTYRELVNLSSEMGQPDLIYKFMQLSAHNSLWNSKKGAAFATGELAARAKAQIAPHLPQLVPKLYRASYDPNPKIAHSMNSILETLVPDQKEALSKYIKDVFRDLLDHSIDSQWRTREASCNALADLLPARDYEQVAEELKELWERCFRVLDDIKESVRKAAEAFKKSLSALTLRLCDPAYTNRDHGRMALEIALPHLMSKGLLSPVKEVRYISINMLQKLAKVASFLLKPHIANLIPVLLTSLASLDSAQLNYLEQHSSSFGISGDVFDEARVAMSKNSPVHATIDTCVQQVDSQNIADLAPKLAILLGSDNHISTRAGAASVITQLALSKPDACKLTAHKLMLALKKGIGARSILVRKAYGYAMGQLSRCAKKKTLETVVTGLLDSYKNSTPEEVDMRSAIAEALLELSKASVAPSEATSNAVPPSSPSPSSNSAIISSATASSSSNAMDVDSSPSELVSSSSSSSPPPSPSTPNKTSAASHVMAVEGKASVPVLAPFYNLVVPVIFLARFDAREETSKVFNKIWEECGVSLALYVPETVSTFATALDSSSWQMKQQGAKAMSKFAESLNLSQFKTQAPQLIQLLLTGMKGRTWSGKESLLDALSKLVASCSDMWSNPSLVPSNKIITPEELIKAVSTEVLRKSLDYKKAALICLTDLFITFGRSIPNFDAISKVSEMLIEQSTMVHLNEGENSESEKKSSTSTGGNNGDKDEESATSRSIRQVAIQALCASFPTNVIDTQKKYFPIILDVLIRTLKGTNQYSMKVAVLNNVKTIFPKIGAKNWDQVVPIDQLKSLLENIFYPTLSDPKYTVVRAAACTSLTEFMLQTETTSQIETFIIEIDKVVSDADKLGQTPVSTDRLLNLISRVKNH
jgi:proteasome component ECM29